MASGKEKIEGKDEEEGTMVGGHPLSWVVAIG